MAADTAEAAPATTVAERYTAYSLLAGQHLITLVTRVALPYLVAFISAEYGFSDKERATLLSSFTAGYVTMQIPGGYLAKAIGNKTVCLLNNAIITVLLLTLPAAARRGTAALAPALALIGVIQGPLMISVGTISTYWLPPPASPERPWAQLAVRMGSHLSKIVGPALTPWLSGRFGWRTTSKVYAGAFACYGVLWQLIARERPREQLLASALGDEPKKAKAGQLPFTPRLLVVRAQLAFTFAQICHDLLEFQTFASWSPAYFHEVLGVPLHRVGIFTLWPMVVGMAGKFGVTAFESALLGRGMARLTIRKLSNTLASAMVMASTVGFTLARTPLAACLLYCVSSLGHCFDYPGFVANSIELQGVDVGIMSSYANTLNWTMVFIFGQLFAALKRATNSWYALFLGPVALRALETIWFLRHASVDSARSKLPAAYQ